MDVHDGVEVLLRRSRADVARGADPGHHATYREAVTAIREWSFDRELVGRLREMYEGSARRERDGMPRQPTYRRALVDVMAVHLSALATVVAGQRVVVSPEQARRVFDDRRAGASLIGGPRYADPEDIVDLAVSRLP